MFSIVLFVYLCNSESILSATTKKDAQTSNENNEIFKYTSGKANETNEFFSTEAAASLTEYSNYTIKNSKLSNISDYNYANTTEDRSEYITTFNVGNNKPAYDGSEDYGISEDVRKENDIIKGKNTSVEINDDVSEFPEDTFTSGPPKIEVTEISKETVSDILPQNKPPYGPFPTFPGYEQEHPHFSGNKYIPLAILHSLRPINWLRPLKQKFSNVISHLSHPNFAWTPANIFKKLRDKAQHILAHPQDAYYGQQGGFSDYPFAYRYYKAKS